MCPAFHQRARTPGNSLNDDPAVHRHGAEGADRLGGVGGGVDRLDRLAAAPAVAAIEVVDLHLLHMAGIRQHHGAQVDGRRGGMDLPAKALLHQLRQQAGMVDMRVRQQHRVDLARIVGEWFPVQRLQRLGALEHAAIHQEASTGGGSNSSDRPVTVRAAPQNRMVTLMRGSSASVVDLAAQRLGEQTRRARWRWSDAARCRSNGSSGCRRRGSRAISSGGNSAWVTTASTDVAPAATQRLGAGDQRAARRRRCRRPAAPGARRTGLDRRKPISTERSPRRIFRATACAVPSRPPDRATQGSRFRVGTDHDGGGIDAAVAQARRRSPAWPTDSSASMPGNTSLDVLRAMQMRHRR